MSDLIPVAIAYDFDGTLAPGNMQEHVFLPTLAIEKSAFWAKTNAMAKEQQGDQILTYMYQMLVEARHANLPMRRTDWQDHGRGITLFPGVADWFPRITAAGLDRGLDIQHFVISSGLREMIEGTPIHRFFKAVFASGFLYDASGVAVAPALAVNYTTKTQFLFRINKGALDLSDDKAVNAFVPPEKRSLPFANITFIGDGDTDVPCFRLVKEQGGHSIAVYPEGDDERGRRTRRLLDEGRVHGVTSANYLPGGDLERRLLAILDLIIARATITRKH